MSQPWCGRVVFHSKEVPQSCTNLYFVHVGSNSIINMPFPVPEKITRGSSPSTTFYLMTFFFHIKHILISQKVTSWRLPRIFFSHKIHSHLIFLHTHGVSFTTSHARLVVIHESHPRCSWKKQKGHTMRGKSDTFVWIPPFPGKKACLYYCTFTRRQNSAARGSTNRI